MKVQKEKELNMHLLYNMVIPFLGFPKEIKAYVHIKKSCDFFLF
jgi:hypothetical protein